MSEESGVETVTELELIQLAIADRLLDLQTAMPCTVDSYDVDKQTVAVTPALNRMVPDGAGNFVSTTLPSLKDIPVALLAAGGMFVSLPIQKGDTGLLVFCSRNIGAWRSTGNQGDPGDLGTHTLDGATFYPGLRPDSKALKNCHAQNMVMGSDTNGSARVVIKPSGAIDLGATVTAKIARAEKVITYLAEIVGWLAGCTPSGTETGLAAIKILATAAQTAGFDDVKSSNGSVE